MVKFLHFYINNIYMLNCTFLERKWATESIFGISNFTNMLIFWENHNFFFSIFCDKLTKIFLRSKCPNYWKTMHMSRNKLNYWTTRNHPFSKNSVIFQHLINVVFCNQCLCFRTSDASLFYKYLIPNTCPMSNVIHIVIFLRNLNNNLYDRLKD